MFVTKREGHNFYFSNLVPEMARVLLKQLRTLATKNLNVSIHVAFPILYQRKVN